MRMRKKPNLIPRMERCADYQIKDPQNWQGHWRDLLAPDCQLRLELGCGKGRFTCETAAAEPEVLFIAIERVPDAMVIAMERAKAMGLKNVRFIDADVADLRSYFAPDEVSASISTSATPGPPTATPSAASPTRTFWSATGASCGTAGRSTSRPTTGGFSSGPSSSSPRRAMSCGRSPVTSTPTASAAS